jgi:hypothetical protein
MEVYIRNCSLKQLCHEHLGQPNRTLIKPDLNALAPILSLVE